MDLGVLGQRRTDLVLLAIGSALAACGAEDETESRSVAAARDDGPQTSDDLYDPAHLLEIEIEMSPADYDALREEGYSLFDFQRGEAGTYPYTEFRGDVRVDGVLLRDVAVRKKGGLGSLSRLRPSLKLNFREYVPGQALAGVTRLTLNNDRTDPSHSRQCMAYGLFRRAGLPAPRCSLAHVTVNGQALGTFTNVEPIKKPFLERNFGEESGGGNLYEGRENGDFTRQGYTNFEIENNEDQNDRSDLRAVVEAMEASDDTVIAALERVIDLDQFRRFWALETLTGNWDSYSGNTNNFYLYHHPQSDRFVFIPWGADTAFTGPSIIDTFNQTLTVYATGALAHRLYNLPVERERHRSLMTQLLEELWDEQLLLGELYALSELSTDALPGAIAQREEYISTYASRLRAELALPAPEWRLGGLEPSDECRGTMGRMQGEFRGSFTAGPVMPAAEAGEFSARLFVGAQELTATWSGAIGRDPSSADRTHTLLFIGLMPDGNQLTVPLLLDPQTLSPGEHPFYNFENVGFVFLQGSAVGFRTIGMLSDGVLRFERAGKSSGDPVEGTFEAGLYQFNCVEP